MEPLKGSRAPPVSANSPLRPGGGTRPFHR